MNLIKVDKSTDLTATTTFKPTPAMKVWLDNAIKLLSDSPTEIARESELTKQAWYKWLKIDGFEEWYYEEYKKRRKRILPTLDKIAMKYANKGSFSHWEALNKKVDPEESDYSEEATFTWKRRT